MAYLAVQLFSTLAGFLYTRVAAKSPTDEPSEMNSVNLGSIRMHKGVPGDHFVKSQVDLSCRFAVGGRV